MKPENENVHELFFTILVAGFCLGVIVGIVAAPYVFALM